VPDFLSSSWLEELTDLAGGSEIGPDATVIQHVVTHGPAGDVAFVVEVENGRVRAQPGLDPRAVATLTEAWETALRLHRGELTAQDAFRRGLIRVRGDMRRVVEVASTLSSLAPAMAVLRASTADV